MKMDDKRKNDARIFHLQAKVTKNVKKRLVELAEANDRSVSDIIRAALYFGLPMLEKVIEMEHKLTALLIKGVDTSPKKRGRPLNEIFDKYR
ncbi:MAG: ribbon-helix-helix protein, CopG family [candidate division Zixibacteria bacterium]|nr:ribbon-helix-helix protein, CopG family [candidate division Zixibacteria bacterium]